MLVNGFSAVLVEIFTSTAENSTSTADFASLRSGEITMPCEKKEKPLPHGQTACRALGVPPRRIELLSKV